MKEWLAVAMGGMIGVSVRHGLSKLFFLLGPTWLPIATLVANLLGCFAIGALAVWSLNNQLQSQWLTIGVRVGLLGGLTTFSSFAFDVVRMWQLHKGQAPYLLAIAHVGLGLLAVIAGMALANRWAAVNEAELPVSAE